MGRPDAYVEIGAGQADQFDSYVNRSQKNSYDIEHVRSDSYDRDGAEFESEQDFDAWRNDVAGLVLLRADVNRSLQDKSFAEKAPHYAKQNVYAASFTASVYQHQPQFAKFRDVEELPFRPFETFGKAEQEERRALVLALADKIWSPDRIEELRP
ncbi:hypothetical protein BTZ20_4120 [Rhodococcus sp. MTM3W5.2]|uniref:HNH endonuclease family protein n=1 Tax=Rhodococcus sp. MTM3W5.2 TaxID=1805827 RepID=UPI0009792668|nr:HNH endonuclease family protein [Rhodococcus sp. MTM3W5.2]AQA22902.1 hypothetical protein BTZ20_4120 [Rhodococcus sp. MTM3W5.2]